MKALNLHEKRAVKQEKREVLSFAVMRLGSRGEKACGAWGKERMVSSARGRCTKRDLPLCGEHSRGEGASALVTAKANASREMAQDGRWLPSREGTPLGR